MNGQLQSLQSLMIGRPRRPADRIPLTKRPRSCLWTDIILRHEQFVENEDTALSPQQSRQFVGHHPLAAFRVRGCGNDISKDTKIKGKMNFYYLIKITISPSRLS